MKTARYTSNKKIHRESIEPKAERPQNKNLIRVPKGAPSPNPAGKPKGVLNFKTRLNMALEVLATEYVKQHNGKKENKKKQIKIEDVDIMGDIFKQYVNKSRNGNDRLVIDIMDRTYGKATQPVELSGKNGNPIDVAVLEQKRKKARAILDRWTGPIKEKKNGDTQPKR